MFRPVDFDFGRVIGRRKGDGGDLKGSRSRAVYELQGRVGRILTKNARRSHPAGG